MPGPDALQRLADTGLKLARSTSSGRVALATLDAVLPPELVPRALRDELEQASAQTCEPLRPKEIHKVLREAWGVKPTGELDDLDDEPVAVTATSVVHRGVLDGRPVAVKIARPGLAALVRSDLSVLDALAGPLGAVFPGVDPAALLAEVRERVLDEFDLEHEGAAQRAAARALRGHATLHVPAVVSRLTHEGVLVHDWVEGTPVLQAPASRRDEIAAALVLFHIGSARSGTVHCDPAPGNAFALDDGRVAFVDFGATRRIDGVRVDLAVRAIDALAARDGDTLGAVLAELGWLPAADGPRALELGAALAEGFLDGKARLDLDAAVEVGERAEVRITALLELAAHGSLEPADLWPLRMLGGLGLLLARLGATRDWLADARAAAAEGF